MISFYADLETSQVRRSIIVVGLALALVALENGPSVAQSLRDTTSQISVSPIPTQRIDLSSELYLRRIGNGAFVISHSFPWPANSLLVQMQNGILVLAGSQYTPEAAHIVLKWIQEFFGHPDMIAVDTGFHVDNLGGNDTYLKAGIPVYGSDLTVKLLHDRGGSTRKQILDMIGDMTSPFYKQHERIPYVPPNHVFPIEDGLKLNIGAEQVIVFYPGPSQAPDKVVVYFPSRKLLFGSCMILSSDSVGNTADADLRQWPLSVRRLMAFPVDVVVPGHGDRLDPGLIQHTLDILAAHR
jgi:metallo-beta-lactamase class B